MSDIAELVDLPDPATQPLVHPLDLPESRRPFRTSWLLAALTSPIVGLCAAGLVWFASNNYVAPVLVGAAVIGFGALARCFFADRAWAFIPRKRQDHARRVPAGWEFVASLLEGLALATTLLLVVRRLTQPDVTANVREFTVGMGLAVSVMVLGAFVVQLLRYRGKQRRRVLFRLPGVAAVVAGVLAIYGLQPAVSGAAIQTTMLWGFVTMVAIGCGIGVWKYREHRRHG